MGSVYRQKGRTIWMLKYYKDGVPIYESSETDSETDARRLLKRREGRIADGAPVSPKTDRIRFDTAADDLLADYQNNGRTSYDEVERRLRLHLRPFFGRIRLSHITAMEVRRYIQHRKATPIVTGKGADRRERPPSNAEINRELTHLKRMFTLAQQVAPGLHRPHIALLEEHNVRQGFFEREQLEAVAGHLSEYLAPVARFAYITGWRIPSEVLTLPWSQVDLNARVSPDQQTDGVVRLEPDQTKNDDGREFAVTRELRELLLEQWRRHQLLKLQGVICPWVFFRSYVKVKGKRITAFNKAWAIACRAAGLPGKIPHDFRRTAVRNLVRAGVPEKVAMRMTGHRTRAVFERYNIVSSGDLAQGSAALDRHHTREQRDAAARAAGERYGERTADRATTGGGK